MNFYKTRKYTKIKTSPSHPSWCPRTTHFSLFSLFSYISILTRRAFRGVWVERIWMCSMKFVVVSCFSAHKIICRSWMSLFIWVRLYVHYRIKIRRPVILHRFQMVHTFSMLLCEMIFVFPQNDLMKSGLGHHFQTLYN